MIETPFFPGKKFSHLRSWNCGIRSKPSRNLGFVLYDGTASPLKHLVVEGECEILQVLPADQVRTDAVEHHSGTESFLGRIVRLGDPFKGSAEHFVDAPIAIVSSSGEGFDVVNGVPSIGVVDVVFGRLGCVYPGHAEQKKRACCSRLGATFSMTRKRSPSGLFSQAMIFPFSRVLKGDRSQSHAGVQGPRAERLVGPCSVTS